MANPTHQFGLKHPPTTFSIRLGRREASLCRDFRKRYYNVNPIVDCSYGAERGHLEVLFFRRWLIILAKARSHPVLVSAN